MLTAAETESLRSLILSSDNIILSCHRSPDGDALGSLLGMAEFLRQQGKVPVAVVPDAYPDFLQWLPGTERIIRYDKHKSFVDGLLASADLVFCLDFNTFSRTDDMADTLQRRFSLTIILIPTSTQSCVCRTLRHAAHANWFSA